MSYVQTLHITLSAVRGGIVILLLSTLFLSLNSAVATPHQTHKKGLHKSTASHKAKPASRKGTAAPSRTKTPYRGWDYLVQKLRNDGVSDREIKSIYLNPSMPVLGQVTFALKPAESHAIYKTFLTDSKLRLACDFIAAHQMALSSAAQQFRIPQEAMAAILLVETQYGKILGTARVINRLSRVASVRAPDILEYNVKKLLREDPTATREQVYARAQYLEDTFYPEVLALFTMNRSRHLEILNLTGSTAGAYGIPQFLPTSALKFGIDGNKNGRISLFEIEDALYSAAHFLSHYGWTTQATEAERRQAIWNYNRSTPYIDTVISIADTLKRDYCTKQSGV
jgi:membrane-bound lytic murein transglycosylase B